MYSDAYRRFKPHVIVLPVVKRLIQFLNWSHYISITFLGSSVTFNMTDVLNFSLDLVEETRNHMFFLKQVCGHPGFFDEKKMFISAFRSVMLSPFRNRIFFLRKFIHKKHSFQNFENRTKFSKTLSYMIHVVSRKMSS